MDMTPVKSSNVEAVGYDSATGTLRVTFKGGGTYDYAGATAQTYGALITAKSPGSYLRKHVRGAFKHTKVDK